MKTLEVKRDAQAREGVAVADTAGDAETDVHAVLAAGGHRVHPGTSESSLGSPLVPTTYPFARMRAMTYRHRILKGQIMKHNDKYKYYPAFVEDVPDPNALLILCAKTGCEPLTRPKS